MIDPQHDSSSELSVAATPHVKFQPSRQCSRLLSKYDIVPRIVLYSIQICLEDLVPNGSNALNRWSRKIDLCILGLVVLGEPNYVVRSTIE